MTLTHFIRPTLLYKLSTTSASGLVRVGSFLYAISDDLLTLTQISGDGHERNIQILAENLPEDPAERKAVKPDFECLFKFENFLIGLGSGATKNRDRGFIFEKKCLEIRPNDPPILLSLKPLYDALREKIPALNIEGAVVRENEIFLAHRGNTLGTSSAIIRLDREKFLEGINAKINPSLPASALLSIYDMSTELPSGYSFTDLAADPSLEDAAWFLAVREETDIAYDDGEFTGAVLGRIKFDKLNDPKIDKIFVLEIEAKPEGLWLEADAKNSLLGFIVTDADSATVRSGLLMVELTDLN